MEIIIKLQNSLTSAAALRVLRGTNSIEKWFSFNSWCVKTSSGPLSGGRGGGTDPRPRPAWPFKLLQNSPFLWINQPWVSGSTIATYFPFHLWVRYSRLNGFCDFISSSTITLCVTTDRMVGWSDDSFITFITPRVSQSHIIITHQCIGL